MTFEEIKEKLNNAGSYEDIENTISLIKDPKLRTQMQEFTNECEWENQDIKLVCIVLIEKFLDPKIDNNQLNELKETKTLPNISKFIYNLNQVDEDDKGIKEGAWSVNDYTKDRLGNKIIIVSQNGISNLTAKDIKSSVEQAYPQLSGQITADEKSIWFYLKPIKGLKESKKKSDFDKLSDKISKEYIKKGMPKSKAEEIGNATAAKIARSKKTESEESNKEFTLEDVDKVAEELNLTFDKFTKEELLTGMNIELEHGTKFPETNVTDDDLIMTAKIALAHLNEYSNYYDEDVGLHNFERELEAALSNKGDKVEENKKITESDESILRLAKNSIVNGKLPEEIKYKGKTYKQFYVIDPDNSGETSDIYYCNMENIPSGDPQESNDYFYLKVALNKTENGYKGIKEIRFAEDLTESKGLKDQVEKGLIEKGTKVEENGSKETKNEDFGSKDPTYIVCSYYDEKLHGLEDELKTDDWSEVEDFAHRKLMQGNMLEIENTKTGKYRRINPDEYDEIFDGEFLVRPEKLDEGTDLKRIARYNEFDNGYVLFDYKKMTDEEAEQKAKEASEKDPYDVYYVEYDDVMNPRSDLSWINGISYNIDEYNFTRSKEKDENDKYPMIATKDAKKIERENKTLTESEEKFSGVEFEKNIPHVMRYKQYDVSENENGETLYWVTQQFFTLEELKQFQKAFISELANDKFGFTEAYVTVRDLSTYDLKEDYENGVLCYITKYDLDYEGYEEFCKEYNFDLNKGWLEESKEVTVSNPKMGYYLKSANKGDYHKLSIQYAKNMKIEESNKLTDNNRKIKIGSKVYWIGAGNEISAEGEVIDFPVDGRMTIKWDDNEQNTYDITHPNIILADNYDNSVNESEESKKITEDTEFYTDEALKVLDYIQNEMTNEQRKKLFKDECGDFESDNEADQLKEFWDWIELLDSDDIEELGDKLNIIEEPEYQSDKELDMRKITESNEEEKNPYENIKVYMNTWGNYNEYGADAESIKGGWMTPDEALEWLDKQEIQEEEPFINDVDGKLPFEVDEYSNPKQVLEQIKDLQSLSGDEAKALSAIMESQNDNYEMCKEILDSGDYIFFPDVIDDDELGHAYVDMVGGVIGVANPEKYINQNEIEEEIRNSLEDSETEYSDEMISELAEEEIENNKNNEEYLDNHFDYEALGRDLDMDGYYFADTGAIYVM